MKEYFHDIRVVYGETWSGSAGQSIEDKKTKGVQELGLNEIPEALLVAYLEQKYKYEQVHHISSKSKYIHFSLCCFFG
jgi:hypothetical protein